MRSFIRRLAPLLLLVAAIALLSRDVTVTAQPKAAPVAVAPQAPTINVPFPLGVQRGQTLELALTGTNLADPTALLTSFPAKVTFPTDMNNGKDAAKLRVKLEVPADAPIGFHSIRLATKHGISNLRMFCVDELPQVDEAADNKTREKAQAVAVPSVVVGRTDAEVSDFFKVSREARPAVDVRRARPTARFAARSGDQAVRRQDRSANCRATTATTSRACKATLD